MPQKDRLKVSIIGCGNMGSGLARRLASNQYILFLYDHNIQKTTQLAYEIGATACSDLSEAISQSDFVLLAIKPQNLSEVVESIRNALSSEHLILSILAGTSLSVLQRHFNSTTIVRMMPNLAICYGQGVIGLVENGNLSAKRKSEIEDLCSCLGKFFWLKEDKMDALTALTGSGLAYALVMIETMVEAAIAMGFKAEQGQELVSEMIIGAVTLLKETKKHPADLIWQIASPQGTTIAGLVTSEQEGLRTAIIQTFLSCYERAQEMDLHSTELD
jgi:pyrroline-5-carboxylate reductase